jgi:hypothetical protein
MGGELCSLSKHPPKDHIPELAFPKEKIEPRSMSFTMIGATMPRDANNAVEVLVVPVLKLVVISSQLNCGDGKPNLFFDAIF